LWRPLQIFVVAALQNDFKVKIAACGPEINVFTAENMSTKFTITSLLILRLAATTLVAASHKA
jgi:hypothetical protein